MRAKTNHTLYYLIACIRYLAEQRISTFSQRETVGMRCAK